MQNLFVTDSSNGLIDFDSNWQCIFVTALTFLLDQAIRRNGLASLAIPTPFLVSSDKLNTVDSVISNNRLSRRENLVLL